MESLFQRQATMLRATSMKFVRSFMDEVNWEAPMLCIRGPRGVGKSTLIRQYVKQRFGTSSRKALYCSLDWVYFSQTSLLTVAEQFYKQGGEVLVLDEVHKYENWSREVKEIAEVFPSLQLILSGSSLLRLLDGDADLSRRCRGYDMQGLSFREYLQFYKGITLPIHSLQDVLENAPQIADEVNEVCRPLQHFHDYLQKGYYPFYLSNPIDYYALIEQTINYIIEVECPQIRGVQPSYCRKMKALLQVLAEQVPFEVDISKLAATIGLQRNTVIEYLNHINDAKLISLLYNDQRSVKRMQKPDKMYLDNPNILYALVGKTADIGTVRECFAVNQLKHRHLVEYSKTKGDFRVDEKFTFEIGGASKSFSQITDTPHSYVLADDIEYPMGRKLPLWMIGMEY